MRREFQPQFIIQPPSPALVILISFRCAGNLPSCMVESLVKKCPPLGTHSKGLPCSLVGGLFKNGWIFLDFFSSKNVSVLKFKKRSGRD